MTLVIIYYNGGYKVKDMKIFKPIGNVFKRVQGNLMVDNIAKNQARNNNEIIYGARALQKNLGQLNSRPTKDWDVYSNRPKNSAEKLSKSINRASKGNYTYTKQSDFHDSTFKVYDVGKDNIRGTKDDFGVADYTKPDRKIKTVTFNNIRYADISETKKDKLKALSDENFKFRHKKDQQDLNFINFHSKKIKSYNKIRGFFK